MKAKEKLENAVKHFCEKENATKEIYGRLTIITYGEKYLIIFKNSKKPLYHLAFRFGTGIEDFIKQVKNQEDKEVAAHNKYLNEKNEEKKLFVPGAIVYSSWGYDQTNIDFYEILERKNDFVIIQEIGQVRDYDSMGDSGTCMPNKDIKIGEPFRKKITKNASINLESYKGCWLWDGKPKSWSSYA